MTATRVSTTHCHVVGVSNAQVLATTFNATCRFCNSVIAESKMLNAGIVSVFWLVVSNVFYFHPYLGKIPILTNSFQINGLKPPTSFACQIVFLIDRCQHMHRTILPTINDVWSGVLPRIWNTSLLVFTSLTRGLPSGKKNILCHFICMVFDTVHA